MLPAAVRMRSAADFRSTTRHGLRVSRPVCVIHLAIDPSAADRRVGIVASKVLGGSVVRHRASRRLRAALAPLLDSLPSGSRVVVRALPGADSAADLVSQVESALAEALARGPRPVR